MWWDACSRIWVAVTTLKLQQKMTERRPKNADDDPNAGYENENGPPNCLYETFVMVAMMTKICKMPSKASLI